ncbi:MAG: hypothetical protein AB8H03_11055 [Saprospiraceae bacterium]
MNRILLIFLTTTFIFISCKNKSSIEGLWVVKSVTVENKTTTPNARWARFNSDFTQESGNGWLQHSFGNWKLDSKTNELSIKNSNGLVDEGEPFLVTINQNQMTWERKEEGQNIKVTLVRSSHLPATYGDKLFGLWKLKDAIGNGKYFDPSDKITNNDYIFFRWDKRFRIGSKKGRVNGVYNVHGHKPEVELIPYGENVKRDFWEIQFEENEITLKLLNTDSLVTRSFVRIHEFPD